MLPFIHGYDEGECPKEAANVRGHPFGVGDTSQGPREHHCPHELMALLGFQGSAAP